MTFQITVFCISLGAEMSKRGRFILLTFTEKCIIIISKPDFMQISVLTIHTVYYRFLQKSIAISEFDTDFCIFCEMTTIGGRKYDRNVQKHKRTMRGEPYDGVADVQGAVYNEELFI